MINKFPLVRNKASVIIITSLDGVEYFEKDMSVAFILCIIIIFVIIVYSSFISVHGLLIFYLNNFLLPTM